MRPDPQEAIDSKALKVWQISGLIKALFSWLIPIVFYLISSIFEWPMIVILPVLLFTVIISVLAIFVIPKIRWQTWRYEINEHEIDLLHGVLITRRVLIPMIRVQHVNTSQGPLLRKYNLASVTISTAAGEHEIPALSMERADAVRDYISAMAKVAEEDV